MKRILLALLAITILSQAKSQETTFGVKGGVNLATFGGGNVEDATLISGFHGGVVANLMITGSFALAPEIVFSEQGAKNYDTGAKTNLTYINIPVLAKLYVSDRFAFLAGPYLGLLLGATAKGEINGSEIEVDASEVHEFGDFGLAFGLAHDVTPGFNLGLRYNHGLTDIFEGTTTEENKVINSVTQLCVGFNF